MISEILFNISYLIEPQIVKWWDSNSLPMYRWEIWDMARNTQQISDLLYTYMILCLLIYLSLETDLFIFFRITFAPNEWWVGSTLIAPGCILVGNNTTVIRNHS